MALGSLLGGGISFLGGLAGDSGASSAESRSIRDQMRNLQDYLNIEMPTIEDLQYDLVSPELVGEYTPEMLQAIAQGDSQMSGIEVDPRLQQQQFAALEQLAGLSEGGLSEGDKMALMQVQRDSAAQDQARQQSILQDMQRRGTAGSGAELISKLKSGQAAADRSSEEGMKIAQMGQQRALEALMNRGNMASNMRTQDFGEKSRVAQAEDAINRFNTQNQRNVQGTNVGNRNMASQRNLGERQRVADTRTQTQNMQSGLDSGLVREDYGRKVNRQNTINQLRGGVTTAQNQADINEGNRTRDRFNSIGNMIGSGGSYFGF